jgi:hypothetical protein
MPYATAVRRMGKGARGAWRHREKIRKIPAIAVGIAGAVVAIASVVGIYVLVRRLNTRNHAPSGATQPSKAEVERADAKTKPGKSVKSSLHEPAGKPASKRNGRKRSKSEAAKATSK